MMQRDVEEGREELNFSEWDGEQEAEDAVETFENGEMPPWYYLPVHAEANLSSAERAALLSGLATTLGVDLVREGERGEDDEEDQNKDDGDGKDEGEDDEDDEEDEDGGEERQAGR